MSQIKKELFFPTPVYFLDLPDAEALNLFLKNRIYAWRDKEQHGIVRSNAKQLGAWHSPTTLNMQQEYALFVKKIIEYLQTIFIDQCYREEYGPVLHNMWANINPKNGYNRSHTHPGSLWSGVYYVQTPLNCGRVVFHDPRAQAHTNVTHDSPQRAEKAEKWSEVYYEALEGRLIVFPSWLRHEVEPNLSDQSDREGDRISISFNVGQAKT